MRSVRILILTLIFLSFSIPSLAQSAAKVTTFAVDRPSVTPDEAESGAAYVNLNWTTQQVSPEQRVNLQVLVLGSWHNALPADAAPLPASGSLRWTVPHTLDFIPPTFRLIIQDSAQKVVDGRELVLPYVNLVDPAKPPAITSFTTPNTTIQGSGFRNPNFTLPVNFAVVNRPARANLVFEQVLDNGSVVNIELPRFQRWIRSNGAGSVKPVADGGELTLRLSLVNVDTGAIYAQQLLSITVMPDTLPTEPDGGPGAVDVVRFTSNEYNVRRGTSLTLTWEAKNATSVWLEVYDLTYFPRGYSLPPVVKLENLPASGSTTVTIPADYAGTGWQMHLRASGANQSNDAERIDIVFTDVQQSILMNATNFNVTPGNIKRGDTVTVSWTANPMTHASVNGRLDWIPVSGYENRAYLEVIGGTTGGVANETVNIRQTGLPLGHSMQITIPNFSATIDVVVFNLGLSGVPIENQPTDVIYEIVTLNLQAPADTVKIENVQAAFQQFERGMMIWDGSTGTVHIFYGLNGGPVSGYLLESYANLPDNPIPDEPPAGMLKPVNAFGRIWGNPNQSDVRDSLGWAVGGEIGYTMTRTTRIGELDSIHYTLPNALVVKRLRNSWNY
jgi:hypothetical protein